MDEETELEKTFKSVSMVGYLTSTCVIVYGVISYFILRNGAGSEPVFKNSTILRLIFLCLAGATLAAVPFIKARILNKENLSVSDFEPGIKKLQTYSIFIFGLCEAIAVYGLIIAILTRNINDYYLLGFISLIAFAYHFPKYENWEEWVRS